MTDIEIRLISEVRKTGREMLFDLGHRQYKNNALKMQIWREIANEVRLTKDECQKCWKNLKAKFKLALRNQKGASGSGYTKPKPRTEWVLKEMDFLRKFVTDSEPTVCSFLERFDDVAELASDDFEPSSPAPSTPGPSTSTSTSKAKKSKIMNDCEDRLTGYLQQLQQMQKSFESAEEMDPFVLMIARELKKVPEAAQNSVKMKLMQVLYDAQKIG